MQRCLKFHTERKSGTWKKFFQEKKTEYPKDLYLRARCNQRMFFDAATLFRHIGAMGLAIFKNGATEISPDIYASYDLFEAILDDEYLVGKTVTIADICAFGSITTPDQLYAPMPSERYPKIVVWVERLKREPFYRSYWSQRKTCSRIQALCNDGERSEQETYEVKFIGAELLYQRICFCRTLC